MGSVSQKTKWPQVLFYYYGTLYKFWVHSWLAHYRWRQSWNYSQLSQSCVFMLNTCSSTFPLPPLLLGLDFSLFCSWGVIPQELKSRCGLNWCSSESLEMIPKHHYRVFTRGSWQWNNKPAALVFCQLICCPSARTYMHWKRLFPFPAKGFAH